MKNVDIKDIGPAVAKLFSRARVYSGFLFVITILLLYVFLVLRVSTLSQAEPSEDAVLERANTVKRLKLDEDAIAKIQQLQDQNIGVKSLFDTARDNPFQE